MGEQQSMSKIVRLIVDLGKLAIVEALYYLDLEILRLVFFGLRNFQALYFLDLENFLIYLNLEKFQIYLDLEYFHALQNLENKWKL